MSRFADLLRTRRKLLLFGGLGVVLVVVAVLAATGAFAKRNPLLDTPQLALETLQAKSLYYNRRALPWLLSLRPDLLVPEDRDENSRRARAFPEAVQIPTMFWQLDRIDRFDALLFVGDPSEYRPLLENLAETKVWTLRYVDHTSMIFRRDSGRPWAVGDFAAVLAHFAGSRPREQAEVLAQAALKLLAIKQTESARALLHDAEGLAPNEPHVGNALATYYMVRGQWREAAEQVERALSSDSEFLPALATKTQLLYGMRQYDDAYELSTRLIAKVPNDPNLLFYHAKIAHEAHAYKTEVETLEKLIKQADVDDRPIGGYQLYLGQAYTAMGDARRAVAAFNLALNDPNLPEDQRVFARENIARIKKRTGM
jgi:tetratricopeptide (TPR) repeat protein